MATLYDRSVDDTYKGLLQIDNSNAGVDGTLRAIQDGEGTSSALQLSSAGVKFTGTVAYGSYSVAFGGNFSTGGAFTTAGAFTTSGAYDATFTFTASTGVTFPTTGTLATRAGSETFTNKTLTSPVMTAPQLGTVASGNISACTSTSMVMVTPILGTVTSGNISACTSTSMTMVTPLLGTPTSGVLTNCTGLPVASVVGAAGIAWTPGFTGFSADPTYSTCTYQKIGSRVFIDMTVSGNGTSNATGFTITGLPFTAAHTDYLFCLATDNSALSFATFSVSGTTVTLFKGTSTTAASWTNSGAKSAELHFSYESTT